MSQEDAATIRRAYEVWNESGPAAVVEQFWAEDAVYREGPGWPEAGVYRGRAASGGDHLFAGIQPALTGSR